MFHAAPLGARHRQVTRRQPVCAAVPVILLRGGPASVVFALWGRGTREARLGLPWSQPLSPRLRWRGGRLVRSELAEGALASCLVDVPVLPGGLVEMPSPPPPGAAEGTLAPGAAPSGSCSRCRPGREPGLALL